MTKGKAAATTRIKTLAKKVGSEGRILGNCWRLGDRRGACNWRIKIAVPDTAYMETCP
jgi:hypothetical protein